MRHMRALQATTLHSETLQLRRSSVALQLEVPRRFNPLKDLVIFILPGLAAPGELYAQDRHYLAQRTGSAVATLTWGRELDLHYLRHPRREHSRQAIAAAERVDELFGVPTRKIIVGHSNGGGDAAVKAAHALASKKAGEIVGVDLEAAVGVDGPLLLRANEMLGATREVLGASLGWKGADMATTSARYCARNLPLIAAESLAAVTVDIRPELAFLKGKNVVVERNVYDGDSVVPTHREAQDLFRHDGNHFSVLDPDVIYANVEHLIGRLPAAA